MNDHYDELLEYINSLRIIDTHEHLSGSGEKYKKEGKGLDIFHDYLYQYFISDIVSAGLGKKDRAFIGDPSNSLVERWRVVEPFWKMAAKTGYGRCTAVTIKDMYGIDTITADNIEGLNARFVRANADDHFHYILKEKSRIACSLLDEDLDCDKEFFRSVFRLDHYIFPDSMDRIFRSEEYTGIRFTSFAEWLRGCEAEFEAALQKGAPALKIGLAYRRSLDFARSLKSDAEECFNGFIKARALPEWDNKPVITTKAFQDYMAHFILGMANRRGLPVQIHTGLQEGNGNYLRNADPSLLCNLFIGYPDIRFDIFHIGYPYQNLLSALGKMFPNVFLDMCWAHIISPAASVDTLAEWIDAVPLNKISAFGGDYSTVDLVYGHQRIARENVARALSRKIAEQVMDLDEAKQAAKLFFWDNPKKLFGLDC